MADVKADLRKQLETAENEFAALQEKHAALHSQRAQIDKQLQAIVDRQVQLQGVYEVLAPYKEKEPTPSKEEEKPEKEISTSKKK